MSCRYSAITCRSPSGRFAHGPWSGPFRNSPTNSSESGPTLYLNTEGQCYGDLDMGSADSALSQEPSPEQHSTSVTGSGDPRPGEKGSAGVAKPRPLMDAHNGNSRTSNSKKLRQFNHLNQPRRMN